MDAKQYFAKQREREEAAHEAVAEQTGVPASLIKHVKLVQTPVSSGRNTFHLEIELYELQISETKAMSLLEKFYS